jgi:hypothetical protein
MKTKTSITVSCTCGNVELTVTGPPIVAATCHCNDCQAGARQIEALPGAPDVMDASCGTAYVMYRKDRVTCSKGAELLKSYKIRPGSATNRMVASCCDSAMLVRFDNGIHWVSLYPGRYDAPPTLMRVNTRYQPEGVTIPDDVPGYAYFPASFVAKLVAARIAMLFTR